MIGDITVGNNVTIGAGSVVLDSIPDNALVVGESPREGDKMNILQFNVRLAEGGAAGVALDLHQRALQKDYSRASFTVTAKVARKASAMITIRRC